MNGFISIGIRLVKKNDRDYFVGRDAAVYDTDTNRLLPAKLVKIIVDPNDIVTAEITLDVAELVIEESE